MTARTSVTNVRPDPDLIDAIAADLGVHPSFIEKGLARHADCRRAGACHARNRTSCVRGWNLPVESLWPDPPIFRRPGLPGTDRWCGSDAGRASAIPGEHSRSAEKAGAG